VTHDREYAIEAAIVKVMKARKALNFNKLTSEV